MAIQSISIDNITVFENLNLLFSNGINLFLGENGTGKTHLMKFLYVATEMNRRDDDLKNRLYYRYFRSGKKTTSLVRNSVAGKEGKVSVRVNNEDVFLSVKSTRENADDYYTLGNGDHHQSTGIFIPAKEMLSHSQGFLALYDKYDMPFDKTLVDIVSNAQLPETREISNENKELLDELSNVIGGSVVMENDTFFVAKEAGMKVDFSLEAEGIRKVGLLWKLIRNGLLEKGSMLFWDEPEANLNPAAIPIIVNVLLKLQEAGVQVFIATHNYILLKAFDLRKRTTNQVEFYSFFKLGDSVKVNQASELYLLQPNPILKAYERLLDETIDSRI